MFVICVFESLTNFRLKEREMDGRDAQNCVHGLHNKVHFMYVDSINTIIIIGVVSLCPWYVWI